MVKFIFALLSRNKKEIIATFSTQQLNLNFCHETCHTFWRVDFETFWRKSRRKFWRSSVDAKHLSSVNCSVYQKQPEAVISLKIWSLFGQKHND